ncbi:uncharacterized protein Dpr1 isoform X1 [Temnothorax longispinosus]|uniref:uncharacterized protein Dpr1 isoform X1 n=3 Tax=Temnothorax longispinosus TaxID=300112 RepID=UPI003A98CFF6
MLCRWLAVLVLAGILLVIEAIAISQGTFTRDQRVLSSSLVQGSRNVSGVPAFETNVPRNVTTAVGQTAFLHCRVHQLGDKEVSWMRKRDMHILSAGILMYTSDLRFQVIHPDKSENWTLQIKSPQQRDSGVYECQVSTEPKMSLNYSLNVVEARARIIGTGDIYVKTGSLLTLTCLMSQGPHDLGTVAWYRGSQAVVTSPRSENDIEAEPRITVETEWSDALTSRLRITHAKPSDSGNYSCVPTVAERASVNVHVINVSEDLDLPLISSDITLEDLAGYEPIHRQVRLPVAATATYIEPPHAILCPDNHFYPEDIIVTAICWTLGKRPTSMTVCQVYMTPELAKAVEKEFNTIYCDQILVFLGMAGLMTIIKKLGSDTDANREYLTNTCETVCDKVGMSNIFKSGLVTQERYASFVKFLEIWQDWIEPRDALRKSLLNAALLECLEESSLIVRVAINQVKVVSNTFRLGY